MLKREIEKNWKLLKRNLSIIYDFSCYCYLDFQVAEISISLKKIKLQKMFIPE